MVYKSLFSRLLNFSAFQSSVDYNSITFWITYLEQSLFSSSFIFTYCSRRFPTRKSKIHPKNLLWSIFSHIQRKWRSKDFRLLAKISASLTPTISDSLMRYFLASRWRNREKTRPISKFPHVVSWVIGQRRKLSVFSARWISM